MTTGAFALRQAIAALLFVVLALSGVGRSMAVESTAAHAVLSLGGVAIPICHTGTEHPTDPAVPDHHDCCDACALCAPASLPDGASFVAPARVEHVARHDDAPAWTLSVARRRTPKLSQGPPAA